MTILLTGVESPKFKSIETAINLFANVNNAKVTLKKNTSLDYITKNAGKSIPNVSYSGGRLYFSNPLSINDDLAPLFSDMVKRSKDSIIKKNRFQK